MWYSIHTGKICNSSFLFMTTTKTKSKTSIGIKTAIAIAALGAAAYAGIGLLGQRNYSQFFAQCYNGDILRWDGSLGQATDRNGQRNFPSPPCMTSAHLQQQAAAFCGVKQQNGKSGVNTYRVAGRCNLSSGYGYGYGYGYFYNKGSVR